MKNGCAVIRSEAYQEAIDELDEAILYKMACDVIRFKHEDKIGTFEFTQAANAQYKKLTDGNGGQFIGTVPEAIEQMIEKIKKLFPDEN